MELHVVMTTVRDLKSATASFRKELELSPSIDVKVRTGLVKNLGEARVKLKQKTKEWDGN